MEKSQEATFRHDIAVDWHVKHQFKETNKQIPEFLNTDCTLVAVVIEDYTWHASLY